MRLKSGEKVDNKEIFLRYINLDPKDVDGYQQLSKLMNPNEKIKLKNGIIMSKNEVDKKAAGK